MKKFTLPLVLALVPAAFVLGAKSEQVDPQTAVLLRIEKVLLMQSHQPKRNKMGPFDHNPIDAFCDGAEFCTLLDHYAHQKGTWEEAIPQFLVDIEAIKGKDFRARFEAFVNERRARAEELKQRMKDAEKK